MKKISIYIIYFVLFSSSFNAKAQVDSIKQDLINHIPVALNKYYFYQDDIKRISDSIKKRFESNLYSGTNLQDFAWQLTTDLRNISGQKHFEINYYPQDSNIRKTKKIRRLINTRKAYHKIRFFFAKRLIKKDCYNYGQIEILPGNIGLLTINNFLNKESSRKTKRKRISSILRKFRNTGSIIIDLRNNEVVT